MPPVKFIHINDFHGRLTSSKDKINSNNEEAGGASQMAAILRKLKQEQPDAIFVQSGDIAQGTYASKITGGKVNIEIMNSLDCKLMVIGNHDFDWGRKTLEGMLREAKFPVLGANVVDEETKEIMPGLKPYDIQEVNGVKIGFLGLITTSTKIDTAPENIKGFSFLSPAETAKKYIPEMKSKGAEIIVILSHLGESDDKKLAQEVNGIDLIIGGHSHTILPEGEKINDTLITQAGAHGKFVGEVKLNFDTTTKEVLNSQAKLYPVISKRVTPDPEVEKIITPVLKEADKKTKIVVGETKVPLLKGRKIYPTANFPEVLTDAVMKKCGKEADMALIASYALADGIEAGPITKGDLYKAIPWDEFIVILNVPGSIILNNLENGLRDESPSTITPSGLTYTFDPSRPSGERIVMASVKDELLYPKKFYRVAMTDFDARRPEYQGCEIVKTVGDVRESLEEYIITHSPISFKGEKRGNVVKHVTVMNAA